MLGHDVVTEADAVRGCVSMTGQFASVDEELNGRENLVLIGRLLGFSRKVALARANELLDAFGLADAADRLVSNYSGGMRRRLDIAASIVVAPEVLFLDEPTTGLDPRSRNQVWEIVRVLVAAGTTVLLTTQYLDEADQLADRIAIIDHGRVIAEGTSGELKALVGSGALHVRVLDPDQREDAARILADVLGAPIQLESDPAALSTRASDPERVADGAGGARPDRMWRSTSSPWANRASTKCSCNSPGIPLKKKRLPRTQHDHDREPEHRRRARTGARRSHTARRARHPRTAREAVCDRRVVHVRAGGRCSRSSTFRCSSST